MALQGKNIGAIGSLIFFVNEKRIEDFVFLFGIECVGVTLVNKIIQVSSVQLNKSSAYCIVRSAPKVQLLSIPIYPPFSLFLLPSRIENLNEAFILRKSQMKSLHVPVGKDLQGVKPKIAILFYIEMT